jgi:hypothetical protein
MKVTAHTKEELIRKFIEKLDYSYNYKTVNERQSIINDICEIAGIEQLNIPVVVGQSEQFFCCKEQINQRCSEQCLGCFQFENKD